MDMVRVTVASCQVCYHELSNEELVDVALGTNYAHNIAGYLFFEVKVDVQKGALRYREEGKER